MPRLPSNVAILDLLKDFDGSATDVKSGITGDYLEDLTDLVSGLNGILDDQNQTSKKSQAYLPIKKIDGVNKAINFINPINSINLP